MQGLLGSCLQQIKNDRRLRAVVAVATLGILSFFALHTAHVLAGGRFDPGLVLFNTGLKARKFSVLADDSYAEMFEYLMLSVIVVTLARLALTFRRPVYVALLIVFAFSLADNALRIHEDFGAFLTQWSDLAPAFGLRAQDFGEIYTWVLFGVPMVGFLLFALWRSAGRHRSVGLSLSGWFLVLSFFGVVIDMISSGVRDQRIPHLIISFVEDGGEMVVIAVILILTLSISGYLRAERAADVGVP